MQKVYGILVQVRSIPAYMEWYRVKETALLQILEDTEAVYGPRIITELSFPENVDLEEAGFYFAD